MYKYLSILVVSQLLTHSAGLACVSFSGSYKLRCVTQGGYVFGEKVEEIEQYGCEQFSYGSSFLYLDNGVVTESHVTKDYSLQLTGKASWNKNKTEINESRIWSKTSKGQTQILSGKNNWKIQGAKVILTSKWSDGSEYTCTYAKL